MKRREFLWLGAMILASTQMGLELLEANAERAPIASTLGEMLKHVYDKGSIVRLQNLESPLDSDYTLGGRGFNFPVLASADTAGYHYRRLE